MANNFQNQNIHEKREKQNDLLRQYEKLKRRYADRPFPERNNFFYYLALIAGWASNVLSAVTESAKVYVFAIGICGSIFFGKELSVLVTIIALIGIELTHRGFARTYFKAWWKYGGHISKQNSNLIGMISLGLFSCFLSFTGGFDFLRVALNPPEKQEIKEISLGEVNKTIAPLVSEAEQQAEEYRQTRLWKGRLSSVDATEWKKLLKKKEAREDSLLAALIRLPYLNMEAKEKAQAQFQEEQNLYELQIQNKGFGLGFVTITAILVMYLCIWFEEKYLRKTQEYLELELQLTNTMSSNPPSPTLLPINSEQDLISKIDKLEKQLDDLQTISTSENGHLPENFTRNPIGFKSNMESTPKKPLQHVATLSQERKDRLSDMFTILHYKFTDGKPVRLTQDRVDWYVGHYENQLDKAQKAGEKESIENFQKKLIYWKDKQQELYHKLEKAKLALV